MKNIGRILACVLVTALLCVGLCGCDALDDARANHGFLTESGNIRLGDAEYILLPDCAELQPTFSNERVVFVTEPDVPVLLSNLLGTQFRISEDELFLSSYWGGTTLYCRADRYDEMVVRILDIFTPTGYGYLYYDPETDRDAYYTLTAEQAAAVEAVCAGTASQTRPGNSEIFFDYAAELMQHSEDHLFRRYFAQIGCLGNVYYLSKGTDDGELLYEVPAEYNATFASILSALVKAESYWEDYAYDEKFDVYV